jgi:hypothetical protein
MGSIVSMPQYLIMMIAAGALCACTGSKPDAMQLTLNPWVGRSIGDYVDQRGPPTDMQDLGPGRARFQWITGEVKPSAMRPTGSNIVVVPPNSSSCLISLVATTTDPNPGLGDWIIEKWSLNGVC